MHDPNIRCAVSIQSQTVKASTLYLNMINLILGFVA